ncbi:MAG: hypothetical protein IJ486_03195 [Firmicutes bacterium]|nr:hypothetical protein [Bacillota bacterium]
MLVYSTKLPLKPEVTQEICLTQFIEWVTGSEHYPIDTIEYDISSREDFQIRTGHVSFAITHYDDEQRALSACRLENHQENALWYTDCIFLEEGDAKTLLIQLHCDRPGFNTQLPVVNKPYIIRKFVEGGYCADDAYIPVTDEPIQADNNWILICAKIMCSEYTNKMPVVYISRDSQNRTAISASYLAKQLSGVAHVFEETDHDRSLLIRKATDHRNVHSGYVGIYFPGRPFGERFSPDDYPGPNGYREMTSDIVNSVRNALINRMDSTIYNWNQIQMMQSRQKMKQWQDISDSNKSDLSDYMELFDSENRELQTKIDELNLLLDMASEQIDEYKQTLHNMSIQLENFRSTFRGGGNDGGIYKKGEENELYPGEITELLHNVLSSSKSRFTEESHPRALIESMLAANPTDHPCETVLEELKPILSNYDRLTPAIRTKLKELGFTIDEDGSHYKLTFQGDSRYMFTLSKTPSDHRGGKNLYSEVCNRLDVNK